MERRYCRLKNLGMSYPFAQGRQIIFDRWNLELELEGITVLLGRSGCGKTTLLRLLAGLEKPETGQILYQQGEKTFVPRIGMVFQESRLLPWLTVEKNIFLSQPAYDQKDVQELMELVGLDVQYAQSLPNALSGGMAHRVAIARALAYMPDVLLMDEPFAALDYFTRLALQQQFLQIQQQTGTAVLFVTHNVDEALLLASQILMLKKGCVPKFMPVSLAHPRELEQPALVALKRQIFELLAEQADESSPSKGLNRQ